MKNKINIYKQKGKTIYGQYLAQIDIGEESQIIIVCEKLKDRNSLLLEIKKMVQNNLK